MALPDAIQPHRFSDAEIEAYAREYIKRDFTWTEEDDKNVSDSLYAVGGIAAAIYPLMYAANTAMGKNPEFGLAEGVSIGYFGYLIFKYSIGDAIGNKLLDNMASRVTNSIKIGALDSGGTLYQRDAGGMGR